MLSASSFHCVGAFLDEKIERKKSNHCLSHPQVKGPNDHHIGPSKSEVKQAITVYLHTQQLLLVFNTFTGRHQL